MQRTIDGRIIDKRVVINKELIKSILTNIKEDKKISWAILAKKVGVCSQTISYDWPRKGNTIPLYIFNKIIKMANLNIQKLSDKIKIIDSFWGQGKGKEKEVKLPDIGSEEFAEFYGVLLGDGCVNSNMKGFSISGDKILDKEYYINYLSRLILKLFGSKPSIIYDKKTRGMKILFYSKKVCKFLLESGFPIGLKCNGDTSFPSFILKNKENLSSCIRGLMDTDGSLSAHPHSKIMIHLSITQKALRKSTINGLKELEISGGEFDKGIMIYGRNKIIDFYKKAGFSNKKNIVKYNYFLKYDRVPSSKEVETFLR